MMKRPTREQLEQLSQAELIALVERLFGALERLQPAVAQLRVELDGLKQPPPSARNSSLPPSRDQKSDAPSRKRKRRGARQGHVRMERALVDNPTQVSVVAVERCACGADLAGVSPSAVIRRQLTELPAVKPVVIETRQHEVQCPCCGQLQRGVLPLGLEAQRAFGPRLEATVTYLQHQQHLSFERTQLTMQELFGLTLSEGGEACIIERAGAAAAVAAETIRAVLRQSAIIGSDETGARLNGHSWWEWVFRAKHAVYHIIRHSRGLEVIEEVMGGQRAQTWLSDCWAPQLRAPAAQFQLCLAHQIRNLQGLRERAPRLRWATELQALLREAIHLGKRRSELTVRGFQRRVSQLERQLRDLLARPIRAPVAQALVKRYRKHREHLLVFLHDPNVPHHNNACERSLRASIVHRKVSGGFRSEWGAHAYAALASVIDTAKLRGESIFGTLVDLMGPPVLHYLSSPNP